MARTPKPGAPKGSPAWRERISAGLRRYQARQRALARVLPTDLAAAERSGSVRPDLRHAVGEAATELCAWVEALGGENAVSAQRRSLLQSAARLGVAERAITLRLLQTADTELASRLATVATSRRALLAAVGLDEQRHEMSLSEYLAQRTQEQAQERGNGSPPAQPPAEGEIARESASTGASWAAEAPPERGPAARDVDPTDPGRAGEDS